ncbi:cell envelope integrity protein TolA, partial [Rhodopseudomonas palustris]|nr:cell envelope integrity protein TolA [Rhodopseudomonas palustris]
AAAEAKREAALEAKRQAAAEAKREAAAEAKRVAAAEAAAEAKRAAAAAAEAKRQAELAEAAHVKNLAREWTPRIQGRVEQYWVRPVGLTANVTITVNLRLRKGGEVVSGSVRILKGSGSPALDASVKAAIYQASPLPVPDGDDFEYFKDFDFRFTPQ